MEKNETMKQKPSFGAALAVIVFLCAAMSIQIFVLKQSYVTHITLIIATMFAAIVAMYYGYKWDDIQEGILYGCKIAMLPMLILMLVGVLIASWIPAGVIPTLIYYGLKILSPKIFLVTVCAVCAVSSLATGSSYTTGATFGVAFMGIGMGLGMPPAMTAGAVISGAIFGDKMSPLSDSTNLAAGVAEADLFDHIKSMAYTTGPAILLSLVIYGFLGTRITGASINAEQVNVILNGLKDNYFISPLTILPAILVVFLAVKRVGGLAVMVIASLVGTAFAMIFQGYGLGEMLNFMNYGFVSDTGIEAVDKLLSRGGLQSMMWTISLGFIALSMGGVLEKTRMLEAFLDKISGLVSSTKGLILTHVFSAFVINAISASQYMAIIIPSRMLVPAYKEQKILPQVNSRTAEDSATVTSPLIPWGLCGVYFTGVLGVPTMEYFPYVYLAFLAPVFSIAYGITGKFIFKEGDIASKNTYSESV